MGTSIWQARKDGWKVAIKCDRRRAGLKGVRPCAGECQLHLSTLIAALGPDVAVVALQTLLKCPSCGTDRFELKVSHPPSRDAGAKDAVQPPRKMRPAAPGGPLVPTLGNTPERCIVFQCDKCGRHGEYRRERLIEEFGSAIDMPGLLAVFAHARGCGRAIPHPTHYDLARPRQCRIRYDIEV